MRAGLISICCRAPCFAPLECGRRSVTIQLQRLDPFLEDAVKLRQARLHEHVKAPLDRHATRRQHRPARPSPNNGQPL
jgi:hypothetical protein